MKPLILGEAPHLLSGLALSGRAGTFLARLAGLSGEPELRARFDLANLFSTPVGQKAGKGDPFPAALAGMLAARKPLVGVTVLLGRRLARAYGLGELPWHVWLSDDGASMTAVIPHPSGVNYLFNDEEVRKAAGRTLSQALWLSEVFLKEVAA